MEEQAARRIADALERIATAVEGIERAMPRESAEELERRVLRIQQERARR